jgi:hypothetical protein
MRFINMPDKNSVIYCVLVDESGSILNTSMLTASHAKHILESASEMFKNRKER